MNRVPLGSLEITIHKGRLIAQTEPMGGEPNAQVEIEVDNAKNRTKNVKYGKEPAWQEAFNFQIYSFNEGITLHCRDQDSILNDYLGSAYIDLKTIAIDKEHRQWIRLKDQTGTKILSEVLITTKFILQGVYGS